jgi:hypothetical protein
MNTKKWIITSLVAFVVLEILNFIVHSVILKGSYQATAELWRPMDEMNRMMWVMWIVDLLWAFLLVYIFTKGYEGKGLTEGLRFGLVIGLFFALPSLGSYAVQPISFALAASWFVFGIITMTILGVVISLIYKP